MSDIKVGDYFQILVGTCKDEVLRCTKVDVDASGNTVVWRHSSGWLAKFCRPVRLTIRPIKTRKVKLMAWLMDQEGWTLSSGCGDRRGQVYARARIGSSVYEGWGDTVAQAVLSVRKAARKGGAVLT